MSHPKHEDDQEGLLAEDGEEASFAERRIHPPPSWMKAYWRSMLEVAMAIVILVLAIRPLTTSTKPATRRTPVPDFPRKNYTFLENPRYLHEDMFASKQETLKTLHNWIELSADGRGYVKIDDWETFDLGEPYTSHYNHNMTDVPVFMVSVFHQLHCLSYLAQNGFDQTELEQEVAHHSAHCFDYLRQSIMCAADTSLEGKTEAGPGWGSKHECKDYDAVLAWANERTVLKFRTNMPGEAVL
ncbi:Oxidase ustYa [Lachnellula suecica]|uniref:Oxidase ustYa n=1 Tax=Lachnellula suecica TaxID=602035 RepID=A0A8T9C919_9HELO|nr:Oxidase ustYa [Lachnellula suecica]